MLLKKIRGEPFTTELPMPVLDQVTPPPPIKDMRNVVMALVTEGGIVPKGNPDRLEWGHSTKWLKYNITGTDGFTEGDFVVVEGSSKNQFTDADPNRTLPLDTVRELERAGRFKKLTDHYYVTVGNVTAGGELSQVWSRDCGRTAISRGAGSDPYRDLRHQHSLRGNDGERI